MLFLLVLIVTAEVTYALAVTLVLLPFFPHFFVLELLDFFVLELLDMFRAALGVFVIVCARSISGD